MRIALFTDGIYPYVIGGMQKHSFYLAKYFAKNQVLVDLYHTNQSEYDINKLEFFSNDEKKYIRSFIIDFPESGKLPGHYISESFEYSKRIFKLFRKNPDVDFVYAKGFTAWKLIDEKRKKYKCAPIGVNFHGYEMFQHAPSLKSKLEQIFFFKNPVLFNIKNSDYVFSYGGKITDLILQLGILKNKIIEIPTGIESNWLVDSPKILDQKRKFVFVGRYERRKGVEELNRSLNQLITKYDFEFHFIGSIPENKKIISDKIIYHGVITDSTKMRSLLHACDILVCPSYSEGMPNVILEAMASGLAVIATDVGAVNLMVSQSNGRLLDSLNIKDLTSAIAELISITENDLVKMKKISISNVREKFIWSKIIEDTIQYITRLV